MSKQTDTQRLNEAAFDMGRLSATVRGLKWYAEDAIKYKPNKRHAMFALRHIESMLGDADLTCHILVDTLYGRDAEDES